jgi:syntaxin 5
MDRTSEFFATASLLKSHGGVAPTPLAQFASSLGAPAGGAASALAPPAGAIARAAKRAARLVERLHALALVQGQYNDPGTELAELSTALKGELLALDAALASLGAGAAHERAGELGAGPRAHWTAVESILRGHVLRVTRRFQEALGKRAAALANPLRRAYASWAPDIPDTSSPLFSANVAAAPGSGLGARQDAFAVSAPATPPAAENALAAAAPPKPAATMPAYLRRRGAVAQAALPYEAHAHAPVGAPAATAQRLGHGADRIFGAGAAQSLATRSDAVKRAAAARTVETTIVELGGMFTRMAALVAEQGDVLARIDADTELAAENVEAGRAELGKFYSSVKANRGFILRLFGVLVLVILLFGIFKR